MNPKRLTVSQVARVAKVTVRTLHHYDELRLLVPSERSGKGYRLYSPDDLQRLHQILLFRELGFGLDGIREVLEAPAFDLAKALRAQGELLKERVNRTQTVIQAVESAIQALEGGKAMDAEKMFDGFEGFEDSEHEEEVKERWGETDAYKESMKRAKIYSKEDWARIKAEADEIKGRLAELFSAGHRAEDEESMDAAEAHRLHIDGSFYPCSHQMHVGLGQMYTADPRFIEHYDKRAPGLAAFVEAAIRANAGRAG
ncbi:MerR family transcriptional regulator [Gemmatimonadota bacterium]